MACAVAAPLLEPSRDFPAWLEAQGVNAEVARAMDSELGIRDYAVLRACVGDGLVRAELLATARDRLPFGFYAVLRQVVKALQGTEPHDGTPRWDDAAAPSPGDVTLGALVNVLLALFSGLSRELLMTARRLGAMDGTGVYNEESSVLSTEFEPHDFMPEDEFPPKGKNEYSSQAARCSVSANGTMEFKNSEAGTSMLGDEEEDCERRAAEGVEDKSPLEVTVRPPVAWRVIKMEAGDNKETQRLPGHKALQSCGENGMLTTTTDTRGPHLPQGLLKNWLWRCVNRKDVASGAVLYYTGKSEEDQPGLIIGNVTSLKDVEQLYPRSEISRNTQWSQQLLASGVARGIGGNIGENAARGPVAFSFDPTTMGLPRPPTTAGCVPEKGLANWRAIVRSAAAATAVPNGGKSQNGQYVCELCQRRFVRSDYLQKHMYTHTGEKPYRCKVCGRGFSQRTNCQRHQGQHLKAKW